MNFIGSIAKYILYFASFLLLLCLNIGLFYYAIELAPIVLGVIAVIVGIVFYFRGIKLPEISDRNFWKIIVLLIFTTFIIEIIIINNFPFQWATDPQICRSQAIYMNENYGLMPQFAEYFYQYPNNINLIIVLGALYKLFGDYSYVTYFFILLVNLSSLFACMTVRNITKNNFVSIIVLLFLQLFAILTTRTYMPYTSNLAILFPILTTYLYTSNLSTKKKIIIIPMVAVLGYQAKLTCLISFIALLLVESIRFIKNRRNYDFKNVGLSILSVVFFFGIFTGLKNYSWDNLGYSIDDTKSRGFAYFLFLGHNPNTGGQWDAIYVKLGDYKGTKSERDSYFYDITQKNIRERGFVGNVKFYLAKTTMAWGCTKMDYIQLNKAFDNVIYGVRHFIWYLFFFIAMLAVFLVKDKGVYMIMLTCVGVMIYLWLSECSFTYVIMFSPMIFALSGVTLDKFFKCKKNQ